MITIPYKVDASLFGAIDDGRCHVLITPADDIPLVGEFVRFWETDSDGNETGRYITAIIRYVVKGTDAEHNILNWAFSFEKF